MYYEYFGLKQPPFKITPDTGLFYSGAGRGDTLDALVYTTLSGEGIIKVVGQVGSGKTMLCRMLGVLLPEKVDIVYIGNPSLSPEDILHAVAYELNLDISSAAGKLDVMHALQAFLLETHAKDRQVVVLIEEAQSMPLETLEEIRLLSNLETGQDKLLQIVLFGQPELDRNLASPDISQLRERITHSFYLRPLNRYEILQYLDFRLKSAGRDGESVFRLDVAKLMERYTHGVVRRINVLADKSMMLAYSDTSPYVLPRHIKRAVKESEFGPIKNAEPIAAAAGSKSANLLDNFSMPDVRMPEFTIPKWLLPGALGLLLLGLLWFYWPKLWDDKPSYEFAATEFGDYAYYSDQQNANNAPESTYQDQARQNPNGAGFGETTAYPPPLSQLPSTKSDNTEYGRAYTEPNPAPATYDNNSSQNNASAWPNFYSEPEQNRQEAEPYRAPEPKPAPTYSSFDYSNAYAEPARTSVASNSRLADYASDSEMGVYLENGRRWIAAVSGSHYTVQLLSVANSKPEKILEFIRGIPNYIARDDLYVFEDLRKGDCRLLLVYGDFPSSKEASISMRTLPYELQVNGPFLRKLSSIKKTAGC